MDTKELKKLKNLLDQAQSCLDAAMGEETDEGETDDSGDAGDNSDSDSGDLAMNSMKMNLSKYK